MGLITPWWATTLSLKKDYKPLIRKMQTEREYIHMTCNITNEECYHEAPCELCGMFDACGGCPQKMSKDYYEHSESENNNKE